MVVTVLNNGKLMKPQKFEKGELVDFTDSKSSFGVTQKEAPFIESYNPDEDWTEKFWFKNFSAKNKNDLLKKKKDR